jgi:hypothetical protein
MRVQLHVSAVRHCLSPRLLLLLLLLQVVWQR